MGFEKLFVPRIAKRFWEVRSVIEVQDVSRRAGIYGTRMTRTVSEIDPEPQIPIKKEQNLEHFVHQFPRPLLPAPPPPLIKEWSE